MKTEDKYKELIDISKKHMLEVKDYEHSTKHVDDVVKYTKELINSMDVGVNEDVCIIAAYWHDVGRIKGNTGH
jgi:HD superfamily phosphodiesterase